MKSCWIVTVGFLIGTLYGDVGEEARRAIRYGAEAKYIYHIVDDEGMPVADANAHVWFSSYGRKEDNADWVIKTDVNGLFSVTHRFNERFSMVVDKKGYYCSSDEIFYFGMMTLPVKDGKWQPYGEKRTLTLKRIRNPKDLRPGKMKELERHHKYPALDKWIGFDFVQGDWCSPYGRGVESDVLLRFNRTDLENGFSRSMDVSFTNSPYAGAYVMECDTFSDLKTTYLVDTNRTFQTSFHFSYEYKDRRLKNGGLNANQYMVFRIRAKVDDEGRFVSAHYGRMLGDWRFYEGGGMAIGETILNPTPNDLNLEDVKAVRRTKLFVRDSRRFSTKKNR